jgi:DNA-binding SARP family transcriptional activator
MVLRCGKERTTARFRLLGQVDACIADRYVDVGPARQRCVLAGLLVDANRCVPVDQLVERVWGGGRLPDRPRNALRTYISLLRKALDGAPAITRQSDGYVIDVDESNVDMHDFRRLVRQARSADEPRAVMLFERALALWKGEAFGMLDTPWLNDLRTALEEERQSAERDLTDIQLRLGQHGILLARLVEWAEARSLDERLAGQVMLALFRAGRQADALRHYERMCRRLTGELGTDPGRALQQLHQRILADDATLYVDQSNAVATAQRTTLPRQLPAAPRLFTGRARELASISAAVDDAGAPVVAISGGRGIGKTWLALHWAYRNLDRFPDGQLHIDMRGADSTGGPTVAASAIRGFLDALGVDRAAIPLDPDTRIGLFRSLVADQRMLFVLDNARDTAQVRPMLPGGPGCTVLVTSRRPLHGLVSAHGAHAVDLDVFSAPEGEELLARYLGADRVAREPQATAFLLARCAGSPQAIGAIGARAADFR